VKQVDSDVLAPPIGVAEPRKSKDANGKAVSEWLAKPGQQQRAAAAADGSTEDDPRAVIAAANADAYTPPEEGDTVGHTQVYVYDPDREYPIYACAREAVQIRLEVGEKMIGDNPIIWGTEVVTGSDGKVRVSKAWTHEKAQSGNGHGQMIEVLLLRANRERLPKLRMQMFTNVGPYTLELNVVADEQCMRAVRWRHPQHELSMVALEAEHANESESASPRRESLSGDRCASDEYEIEVMAGSPKWVPLRAVRSCIADHSRVYIQFPDEVAWRKIPSLKADNGVAVYDYDASQRKMIVDGLFNNATLSLGNGDSGYEKVSIRAISRQVAK